jgi:hypothetical protein
MPSTLSPIDYYSSFEVFKSVAVQWSRERGSRKIEIQKLETDRQICDFCVQPKGENDANDGRDEELHLCYCLRGRALSREILQALVGLRIFSLLQ